MTGPRRRRRIGWSEYVGAAAELVRLGVKHRGSLEEIQAELDWELEWDRFRAQHGELGDLED